MTSERQKAAEHFAAYIQKCPKPLGDAVVLLVDTAKAIQYGAAENDMKLSDHEAFSISLGLLQQLNKQVELPE